MPDPLTPARPPPLLIADDRALDFLNTLATPAGEPVEWLTDGADLLAWLRTADLLPAEVAARYAVAPRAALDPVATQARTLREWFRGFLAAHAGAKLRAEAVAGLQPLNDLLGEDRATWRVAAAGDGVAWRRERGWETPRSLLQPVAEAIGQLLCRADFSAIRRCEGHGCTLWFRDVSARQTRRWCSMAGCGNRAKAAAHRARLRAATAG
jgi:predicted RNA-binding Zn ribbon-like protein